MSIIIIKKRSFPPLYALSTNYTAGLVNYWPVFGSTATPVYDMITGQVMTSTSPMRLTGRNAVASGAIGVRDINTFWTLPAANYFPGDFTIMGWVKTYACNDWGRFVDCTATPQVSDDDVIFSLSLSNNCHPYFNIFYGPSDLGNIATASYTTPVDGVTWKHMAWTMASAAGVMYADGVVIASGSVFSPKNVTRSGCYVGKMAWNGDFTANADFDEIKFFDRALSQAEVQNDFSSISSFLVTV
jgi:hypothetical protein